MTLSFNLITQQEHIISPKRFICVIITLETIVKLETLIQRLNNVSMIHAWWTWFMLIYDVPN